MSTLTSALNVLSTVLPELMLFSLVRTTAPPLPGLWCWNQMTCQSWPSRLSTMPFFRSFVVAMRADLPSVLEGLVRPVGQRSSLVGGRSGPGIEAHRRSRWGERRDQPCHDLERAQRLAVALDSL